MSDEHPEFKDFQNTSASRDESKTFALWTIANELKRIADELEEMND